MPNTATCLKYPPKRTLVRRNGEHPRDIIIVISSGASYITHRSIENGPIIRSDIADLDKNYRRHTYHDEVTYHSGEFKLNAPSFLRGIQMDFYGMDGKFLYLRVMFACK